MASLDTWCCLQGVISLHWTISTVWRAGLKTLWYRLSNRVEHAHKFQTDTLLTGPDPLPSSHGSCLRPSSTVDLSSHYRMQSVQSWVLSDYFDSWFPGSDNVHRGFGVYVQIFHPHDWLEAILQLCEDAEYRISEKQRKSCFSLGCSQAWKWLACQICVTLSWLRHILCFCLYWRLICIPFSGVSLLCGPYPWRCFYDPLLSPCLRCALLGIF